MDVMSNTAASSFTFVRAPVESNMAVGGPRKDHLHAQSTCDVVANEEFISQPSLDSGRTSTRASTESVFNNITDPGTVQ